MLQPIIRNDYIDALGHQLLRTCETVPRDDHLATGQTRKQHRLIADLPPRGLRMHAFGRSARAAIAAGDDADPKPCE